MMDESMPYRKRARLTTEVAMNILFITFSSIISRRFVDQRSTPAESQNKLSQLLLLLRFHLPDSSFFVYKPFDRNWAENQLDLSYQSLIDYFFPFETVKVLTDCFGRQQILVARGKIKFRPGRMSQIGGKHTKAPWNTMSAYKLTKLIRNCWLLQRLSWITVKLQVVYDLYSKVYVCMIAAQRPNRSGKKWKYVYKEAAGHQEKHSKDSGHQEGLGHTT